jgi:hypothetical protein
MDENIPILYMKIKVGEEMWWKHLTYISNPMQSIT